MLSAPELRFVRALRLPCSTFTVPTKIYTVGLRIIARAMTNLATAALLTRSQPPASLMLRAGVSRVLTASAVFLDTFPRLAAESTPRST